MKYYTKHEIFSSHFNEKGFEGPGCVSYINKTKALIKRMRGNHMKSWMKWIM